MLGNRLDAVDLAMDLTRRSIEGCVSPVLPAQIRPGTDPRFQDLCKRVGLI